MAVADLDGRVVAGSGEIDRVFFIRSAAKPFQAAVALRLGGEMPAEWLAVASSSHDGDPVHRAIVEAMLTEAGLDSSHLRCPMSSPLGEAARHRTHEKSTLAHNCSGKHAAMLRACVAQGWETESYLDPGHPLQRAVTDEMRSVFGEGVTPVGVDGCGAPVHRVTTRTLAGGFARLATDPGYQPVLAALTTYPALVSGVGNDDAMAAVWLGGAAKRGAEGCIGLALPGRGAIGLKVWDGNQGRAVPVALHAVLDRLGWIPDGARPHLEQTWRRPVLGSGREVGTVRAAFQLERV